MLPASDTLWLALVVLGGSLAASLIFLGVLLGRLRETERRLDEKESRHETVLDRLQEN
ncbi:MAG: hypothetical protein JNK59_02015, partial [Sterolibacteriaceae bacterium]|nr:hypothetical protein [Sterolibacteriaceae bacterium]